MRSPVRTLFALALSSVGPASVGQDPALAARADAVLRKHCFECHGKDAKKPKGKLNLFDRSHLTDPDRAIVVAGKPDESELVKRVLATDDTMMPPDGRPKMTAAEQKTLRDWAAAGAPAAGASKAAAPAAGGPDRAAQVKEIFRARCLECHGGSKTNAGVKILDREQLVAKQRLVPGKPDESVIVQLVTATDGSVMPPQGQPPLSPEEIDAVRRWVADGAAAFPPDVAKPAEADAGKGLEQVAGVEYVLGKILAHVRDVRAEDRRYKRYFSINHVLTAGATAAELDLQRDALAKAVNHLSRESRIVRPTPIDPPANTVFCIDLRTLGWHQQPYERFTKTDAGKLRPAGKSPVTVFDLALLEYPYGVLYEDSEVFDRLRDEFLIPADMARPIPYVRADWFCSVVTQPPFYEDFLKLPFTLPELERQLGVDADGNLRDYRAVRAGMTVSGVSRNNRVVERHPAPNGAYWKSYDFRTSRGPENMFKDPIDFHYSGGEMIFNLPNGLQGYYVSDNRGNRIEAAPTDIVIDKFATDKTVRNGLACMRCHDQGMKGFADNVRPAVERLPGSPGLDKRAVLQLYPEQKEMDAFLKEDGDRFLDAMRKVLGRPQAVEPLIPVTRRYLDDPVHLGTAAGELGLADPRGLEAAFKSPQFATLGLLPLASQGVVRRDAWEEYFDQAVRGLGLGVPVAPIDGVSRRDYPAGPGAVDVELKTNQRANVFRPGDDLVISVVNRSPRPIYLELVGTSTTGRKTVLADAATQVGPGQTYRFPAEGAIKVGTGLGKEQVTLLAGHDPFPAGEVLRGPGVTDRVVRPLYRYQRVGGRTQIGYDPARMVKRTIDIETR